MDTNELVKKLEGLPELKKHIEEMVRIAENDCEGVELADDAEEKTILAVRHAGKAVLQNWAEKRVHRAAKQMERQVSSAKKSIKKSPLADDIR